MTFKRNHDARHNNANFDRGEKPKALDPDRTRLDWLDRPERPDRSDRPYHNRYNNQSNRPQGGSSKQHEGYQGNHYRRNDRREYYGSYYNEQGYASQDRGYSSIKPPNGSWRRKQNGNQNQNQSLQYDQYQGNKYRSSGGDDRRFNLKYSRQDSYGKDHRERPAYDSNLQKYAGSGHAQQVKLSFSVKLSLPQEADGGKDLEAVAKVTSFSSSKTNSPGTSNDQTEKTEDTSKTASESIGDAPKIALEKTNDASNVTLDKTNDASKITPEKTNDASKITLEKNNDASKINLEKTNETATVIPENAGDTLKITPIIPEKTGDASKIVSEKTDMNESEKRTEAQSLKDSAPPPLILVSSQQSVEVSTPETIVVTSAQPLEFTDPVQILSSFSAGLRADSEYRLEDDSDAETVISDSQPSSLLKPLMRSRSRDTTRKALKRKAIFSSDEEDSDTEASVKSMKHHKTNQSKPHDSVPAEETIDQDHDREPKRKTSTTTELQSSKSKKTQTYKIKRDSTGRSQLQRACKKGDLEEVNRFIERGADPNECDFGGFTCLHEAALAGHTDIVHVLIQNGADVNKQASEAGDMETPLMDACENKHYETVQLLLQHGADPNICNLDGHSAFTKLQRLLSEDDSYDSILELLEKHLSQCSDPQMKIRASLAKAQVDDPSESYFKDLIKKKYNNIYRFAAQGEKEATAEYFITHALDLAKMPDILILAARNGHIELVDILLGLNPNQFNINQKNKAGVNVLHATVGRGLTNVVKSLLLKGADPSITRGGDSKNALEIAESSARYDLKEILYLQKRISDPQANLDEDTAAESAELAGEIGHTSDTINVEKKETFSSSQVSELRNEEERTDPQDAADVELLRILESTPEERPESVSTHNTADPQIENPVAHLQEEQETGGTNVAVKSEVETEHESGIKEVNEARSDSENEMDTRSGDESRTAEQEPENSKELEEFKLRAAEEAKVWQEKMLAKKRARKEMFLQAEKEKEKRRKEEEERRIQEMKAQEERKKQEMAQLALAAKKEALVFQQKQAAFEVQLVLLRYPIGLQEALFDRTSARVRVSKFGPLYIFKIGEVELVVDLQLSLLLSHSVSDLHRSLAESVGEELDMESKNKLWLLFFNMIGVSRLGVAEKNGREKFCDLSLHWIKLSSACQYMEEHNPEIYSMVWEQKQTTRVNLAAIEYRALHADWTPKPTESDQELGFVPPKLKKRQDVVHTIHTAGNSLW